MALDSVPSILKKPPVDSADQVAKFIAMLEAQNAELKARCEHECAERAKEREARLQAEMATTTARAEATAANARADAAERAIAAETRRADDNERMRKACVTDGEQLRSKMIAEVEMRAKAEGALTEARAASGKPVLPHLPAARGKVHYDVRRDEMGNVISIDATPEG